MSVEQIIRVAQIPKAAHPLPIYTATGTERCPHDGLRYRSPLAHTGDAFRCTSSGRPGRSSKSWSGETMRIALDQARALLRLDEADWSTCKVEVPDSDSIDPRLFLGYLAD